MLEKVSLFAGIDPAIIQEIEAASVKKTYLKNAVVFSEGDQSDSLYIVLSGKAKAVVTDENGKQMIVNVFHPTEFFGEMSFFDHENRCATVLTAQKSQFWVIPRKAFFTFLSDYPEVSRNLIKILIQKLRLATRQMEELAFKDVYGRVARFLTDAAADNGIIEERITHQEIGNRVGASRETVSRIMTTLTNRGYLQKSGGRLTLLNKLPYKF